MSAVPTDELQAAIEARRELGAMGISIPLLAIAAIFTGLAGVIVVCAAFAVIALATRP